MPVVDGAHILTSAPVSGLSNDAGIRQAITMPLAEGLLDATWRPDIVMAGHDGDVLWTAHTGTIAGLFLGELWGVPPSGRHAEIRYGEFTRVVDGDVVELRVLADLPGLAAQAGWQLFSDASHPGSGWSGRHSSELDPASRVSDEFETERTAALLERHESAGTDERDALFRPDARRWTCHGFEQMAAGDGLGPAEVRIVDGEFAATCRWPTDGGSPWMTFLVREDDHFVASWNLVDLVHLAAQRGEDLLART